jgi:hypothetical protein
MSLQPHVIVFARAPQLGRGKRRLAHEAGDLAALRFHRLNTARILDRVAGDPRWTTWLAVTPDTAVARPQALWRGPARIIPQGRGDLGTRMANAMAARPPGPVVVVGSDIPDIQARHVAAAFGRLGRYDAVIGPADDGGYWLIGMRRRPSFRPPFSGVRWGGTRALADTVSNLRAQGQSVAFLEELSDVDTAADLRPDLWR